MKNNTNALVNERDHFQGIYLEWLHDWVTITEFAESHNLTEKQARQQIEIGRKIHDQRTSN